jgi:iron complex outermembrane receptor protein
MKQNNFTYFWVATLLFLPCLLIAQTTVTGTAKTSDGTAIPFANVLEKGTFNGAAADINGNFTITVEVLPTTLMVSYVGYTSKEMEINSDQADFVLTQGDELDAVVIVGNRSKPRSVLTSVVPIDNIQTSDLLLTGQPTLDKMLTYKVPSFNSTNQTVSDATAHFDPADLRGLGPSRTLVLINGKRKNQSALVYINDTPGKGEVGVDLKSIPAAAVERVEVLRDGASAQYGSDAIAGVINMVLKEGYEYSTVNIDGGLTTEGDGFNIGANLNTGIKVGEKGGFLNLTAGYYHQDITNRAGEPGDDALFGVEADDAEFGQWLSENPDLGMTIGQPEIDKYDLFYNFGIPFENGKGKFYTFGGLTYREGTSFALYRTPYWVPDPNNLLHEEGTEYQGFQPTFETEIIDNNHTVGLEFLTYGFDIDVSGTYGRNSVDYMVNNSLNPALGASSPTNFDVGGYTFSNSIFNLDVSRNLGSMVSIAFGAEYKDERFSSEAGQPESYIGGGAQSFPGLQPSNAVRESRNNLGAYASVDVEATKKLLFTGAARYEDFSDFGDNTSWKVGGRYILGDNRGAIRASYGTGFRAPSLHQIYLSNVQTLVSGGTISNQGTFNNVDPIIREGLEVPQLIAETSKNISAGITYKITPKLSVAIDGYQIEVEDRVVFSGEIGFDGDDTSTNPVEQILLDNSITSLKIFTNAIDTKTQGVDIVANYRNIEIGSGVLNATLAANFNETEITNDDIDPSKDGLQVEAPGLIGENGYDIFNRKEQSRIESARPQTKVILGLDYQISKFNVALNNTYFGEVTWQHATIPENDQTFSGKFITDLILMYDFSSAINAKISVNNLFNVYPDEIETQGDVVTDLGGRFKYPWEVNQFGFSGTIISAGLQFRF